MAFGYGYQTQEELDAQAEQLAAEDAASAPPPPPPQTTGTEAAAVAGAVPAVAPSTAYQGDPTAPQPGLDEGYTPDAPVAEPPPSPPPASAGYGGYDPFSSAYTATTPPKASAAPVPLSPVTATEDLQGYNTIAAAPIGQGGQGDFSAGTYAAPVPPPPASGGMVPRPGLVPGGPPDTSAQTDIAAIQRPNQIQVNPYDRAGYGGRGTESLNPADFGKYDPVTGTINWLQNIPSFDSTDIQQAIEEARRTERDLAKVVTPTDIAMLAFGGGPARPGAGGIGMLPEGQGERPPIDIFNEPVKEPTGVRPPTEAPRAEPAPPNGNLPGVPAPDLASWTPRPTEPSAGGPVQRGRYRSWGEGSPESGVPTDIVAPELPGSEATLSTRLAGLTEPYAGRFDTTPAATEVSANGRVRNPSEVIGGPGQGVPSDFSPVTPPTVAAAPNGRTWGTEPWPAKDVAAYQTWLDQQAAKAAAARGTEPSAGGITPGSRMTEGLTPGPVEVPPPTNVPEAPAPGGGGAGKLIGEAATKQELADARISEALGEKLLAGTGELRTHMEDLVDQANFAQTLRDATPAMREKWNAAIKAEQKIKTDDAAWEATQAAKEQRARAKAQSQGKGVIIRPNEIGGNLPGRNTWTDYGPIGNFTKAIKDTAGEFGGIVPLLAGAAVASPIIGNTGLILGQKAKNNTEASLRDAEAGVEQWLREHGGASLAQWSQDNIGPQLGAAKDTAKVVADAAGGVKDQGFPFPSFTGSMPVGFITGGGKDAGAPRLPGPGGSGQPIPESTQPTTGWGFPTSEAAWTALQQAAQQAGSAAQQGKDAVGGTGFWQSAVNALGPIAQGAGNAINDSTIPDQIGGGLDQFRQDVQSDPGGTLQSLIDAAGGLVGGSLDRLAAARGQTELGGGGGDIGMPWDQKAVRDGVPAADATAANLTTFPNTAWPHVSILVNPAGGKYGAIDQNGQFVTFADAANLTDEQNKAVHMQRLDEIEAAIVKQGGTGGVAEPTGSFPIDPTTVSPVTPVSTGDGGGTGGGGTSGGVGTTTYPSSGGGGGGTYPSSGGSSGGGGTYHRSYGGSSGGYSSGGYSSRRKKRKKGTTGSMGSSGGMWPGFPFNRPNSPMRQHILDAIAMSMNKNKGR